jgi:hypothetical protein
MKGLSMSHVQEAPVGREQSHVYDLQGQLLEVCSCNVLCPCWIGEDPDGGVCEGVIAWKIERGEIQGVDVSGLTLAVIAHIPGNVLQGNWKAVVAINDTATPEQEEAMLGVFTGQLGGPVADLAGLVGEVVAVERVPITSEIVEGKGRLIIGDLVEGDMEPYQGATGATTALSETVFSTIPGSPAYISKATQYTRRTEQYGIKNVDLQGHNAVQGSFRFQA